MKTSLSIATAVALTVCFYAAPPAEAGLRGGVEVRGKIGGAHVGVRLHTPTQVVQHRYGAPRWDHNRNHQLRLSRHERQIIHRLSVVTGIPKRPLLRQRARGLSWRQIAVRMDISHREMRIARNAWKFERWLDQRHDHRGGRGGRDDGPGRGGRGGRGGGKGHGR